jgi:hypothetical protein
MKVGIVAEGPADIAVLRNILHGKLGLQRKDSLALRPELSRDETDLAADGAAFGYRAPTPESYSNWALVLEECRCRTKIEEFLMTPLAGERFVIVHIDTAEAHHNGYDIPRPDRKRTDYSDRLRALVAEKIDALLGSELAKGVRHAIAIEETEAWVLTIHDDQHGDTGARQNSKERLRFVLYGKAPKVRRDSKVRDKPPRGNKSGEKKPSDDEGRRERKSEYDLHDALSLEFRDRSRLEACAQRNRSLRLFVDSL